MSYLGQELAVLDATSVASQTAPGLIEIATAAECAAMVDAFKAITPAGLASLFTKAHSAPGFQRFPNGLIIQWGSIYAGNGAGATVSLPITFPTNALSMVASHVGGGAADSTVTAVSLTTTTAYVNSSYTSVIPFLYIAIGY
jgi:hypothetical protein